MSLELNLLILRFLGEILRKEQDLSWELITSQMLNKKPANFRSPVLVVWNSIIAARPNNPPISINEENSVLLHPVIRK